MGTSHPLSRVVALVTAVVPSIAVVLFAAPPAFAGTTTVGVGLGELIVNSADGGTDELKLENALGAGEAVVVRVTEVGGGSLNLGPGCAQVQTNVIDCPTLFLFSYAIFTRDGNDRVDTTGLDLPGTFHGGGGNDLFVNGFSPESFDGGGGVDTVDYSTRNSAVTVTINGNAGDGEEGEGDNIMLGVEKVIGGSGNDRLTGSALSNVLSGGPGNDLLVGGPGNDILHGGAGFDSASYQDSGAGVVVTIDGKANDGVTRDRELDNVSTDIEGLIGGKGNDRLTGSGKDNVLDGGKGADAMLGGGGTDTVSYASRTSGVKVSKDNVANDGESGEGDNVAMDVEMLRGGNGADLLVGSSGADSFDGGPGADDIKGLGGTDTISYASRALPLTVTLDDVPGDGESGENDNVHSDVENVIGGSAGDSISGWGGSNRLEGRGGNDTLDGVGGADMLDGGPGADTLEGGEGLDTATYAGRTAPVNASLDGFTNDGEAGEGDTIQTDVENLIGGTGDDTLTGGPTANVLDGGLGADVMNGGAGLDTVTYSVRTATVNASANDVADDGETGEKDNIGSDVENLTGGSGPDALHAGAGPSVLTGGAGNDYLEGTSSADKLYGGPGHDAMVGGAGADQLFGEGGDDSLEGGLGTDKYDGGGGADIASYFSSPEPVTADLDGVADDGVAGENENLGATIEGIQGTPHKDTLTGNNGPNHLDGGHVDFGEDPTDVIKGLGGKDILKGGFLCHGGGGDDTITFCGVAHGQTGNDKVSATTAFGNDGNDNLTGYVSAIGGPGSDLLSGGDPDAVLDGGSGADRFKGQGIVNYGSRVKPIRATADGVANDGETGEGDNILPGGSTDAYELGVIGGAAADHIVANRANGGSGGDLIYGTESTDELIGGGGNDTIDGKQHNDVIVPGSGDDTVQGGGGADIVYASPGADFVQGGGGFPTDQYVAAYYAGPVKISLNGLADDGLANEKDNVIGFEFVWGTSANDILIGDSGINRLFGLDGNDALSGGGGNDVLFGGFGNDTLHGGAGVDGCDSAEDTLLSTGCEEPPGTPPTIPPPPPA